MVRGFYMLGSGMLTESRRLTGVSNNLANINTPGYKKERLTSTTFGSMVMNRIDSERTPLGTVTFMDVPDELRVIHSQGTLEETQRTLDFAVQGEGFFAVQGQNGVAYTRNGSFHIDNEGYLCLGTQGRVLGQNGPIQLGTDQITADEQGNLFVDGQQAGTLAVYDFADYGTLRAAGEGLYTAQGQPALVNMPQIRWKTIEGSNVDATEEMTSALSMERQIQNCSQALKMIDQVMSRAVSDIARI